MIDVRQPAAGTTGADEGAALINVKTAAGTVCVERPMGQGHDKSAACCRYYNTISRKC